MVNQVPFVDLKAQYRSIKAEIAQALERILEDQKFILGEEVEALEKELASYSGVERAVGVASGTDALLLSLLALGVGPGDQVITTPFTFVATASVILRAGAEPVFVDIDPESFNIRPELVETKISPRTRAIIPVHLFGQCADVGPLVRLSQRLGIPIIEDASQAVGADYSEAHRKVSNVVEGRAGSMGKVGCLSFFPSKNLGGFGDGGMVLTNDVQLAERIGELRAHGFLKSGGRTAIGLNSRLDAIQAAVLRVKLKYLDRWIEARRVNAGIYLKAFKGRGLLEGGLVYPPVESPFSQHTYHQYVIRAHPEGSPRGAQERDRLQAHLTRKGVATAIYYPVPLHLSPAFQQLGYRPGDLPEAERAASEVLALPIYSELRAEQIDYVVDSIAKFYGSP